MLELFPDFVSGTAFPRVDYHKKSRGISGNSEIKKVQKFWRERGSNRDSESSALTTTLMGRASGGRQQGGRFGTLFANTYTDGVEDVDGLGGGVLGLLPDFDGGTAFPRVDYPKNVIVSRPRRPVRADGHLIVGGGRRKEIGLPTLYILD